MALHIITNESSLVYLYVHCCCQVVIKSVHLFVWHAYTKPIGSQHARFDVITVHHVTQILTWSTSLSLTLHWMSMHIHHWLESSNTAYGSCPLHHYTAVDILRNKQTKQTKQDKSLNVAR